MVDANICEGDMASRSSFSKMYEFMTLVGQLKRVKRTGWILNKVNDPESVADHMYRMAMLSFLISPDMDVSKDKCIKISLVHDLAECIVGDLAPSDGIPKEEKQRREETAMHHITSLVSDDVAAEILSLWKEYENQTSKESIIVKDLDRFDMILQAQEYEQLDNKPGQLQEFFNSTKGKFQTQQVKDWVEELYKIREATLKTDKPVKNNTGTINDKDPAR